MADELLLLLSARPLLVAVVAFAFGVIVGMFATSAIAFWRKFG